MEIGELIHAKQDYLYPFMKAIINQNPKVVMISKLKGSAKQCDKLNECFFFSQTFLFFKMTRDLRCMLNCFTRIYNKRINSIIICFARMYYGMS